MNESQSSENKDRDRVFKEVQARAYERFVESIIFLRSSQEIRTAVRNKTDLDRDLFKVAMDEYASKLRENSRDAELALLEHIRAVLLVDEDHEKELEDEISSIDSLVKAAFRCETAMSIRRLFVRHIHLLDEDGLGKLLNFSVTPNIPQDERANRLKILVIASSVSKNPESRCQAYLIWGSFLGRQGNVQAAYRWFARGERIANAIDNPFLKRSAFAAQGGFFREVGDLAKAVEVFKKALNEALAENDDISVMGLREALASCYRDLGRYEHALDQLNVLLQMPLPPEMASKKIRLLLMRGLVHENLGRYHAGQSDYESALGLARSTGNHSFEFELMNNIAGSYSKRGMIRDAIRSFQSILRDVQNWGNPEAVASTRNNLGTMLLQLNRPADALTEFQQSLQVKLNSGGMGELITLLGMAEALEKLGDKKSAEVFSTLASVPVLESGDSSLFTYWILNDTSFGDEFKLNYLEKARDMWPRGHFNQMLIVKKLADKYLDLGDEKRAIDLYAGVIPEIGVENPSAPEQLRAQVAYAQLLSRAPETSRMAIAQLLRAHKVIEGEIASTVLDERRSEIIGASLPLYEALIEMTIELNVSLETDTSPEKFAFTLHDSAKSRSFLSVLANAPLEPPTTMPKKLVQLEARLLQEERNLQEATSVQSEVFRTERLKELALKLNECYEEMRQYSTDYARLRSGLPLDFVEIRNEIDDELDESSALVSLFCWGNGTFAFILRPGWSEPKALRVPISRAECEAAALQIHRTFNGAPNEFPPFPPIRGDRPFERDISFLDRLGSVWQECFEILKDVTLLHIVPHGPFHLIPFHALKMQNGAYVAEQYAVVYWPSISTALQILRTRSKSAGKKLSIYVAGISAAEDEHPEYFEQDAKIFDTTPCKVKSRYGVKSVSRDRLLEEMPLYDIIHLSCHGYFESAKPLDSGLMVSNGRSKPPRDPWALSIMDRNKYLIRANDLYRRPLSANLVTLNACSSGLQGQRNNGDELDGFARTLLLAGASTVMLTMWNVDQRSSSNFLEKFYTNWLHENSSMPKWRALHEAQKEFLDSSESDLRHPYHWAPYALIGDWK